MEQLSDELRELGQYIPLHYHHVMLGDEVRMNSFRESIERMVPEGGVVVELGGGTGVLSYFAAVKARKVYCVERNPDLLEFAAKTLQRNGRTEKIELVNADAMDYLPSERVDVVICEMLHTALIREKQIAVIESFKRRYTQRFGPQLPIFIPDASFLALQGVAQKFDLYGYDAPIPTFQHPYCEQPNTTGLTDPKVYAMVEYSKPLPEGFAVNEVIQATTAGTLNALRFITKNLIAVLPHENRSIDWHNHYLVLPISQPIALQPGDKVEVRLRYAAGARIADLQEAISVRKV